MTDDRRELFRLRVRYQKGGRLAYLGHLEVINTINRCIRRSGLPFCVGNGFARRIRLQFSQALPVGASSTCEYYDLMLTHEVAPAEALGALEAATPAQLAPVEAGYVPRKVAALEAWAGRSLWEVELGEADPALAAEGLDAAIGALRERRSLEYLRGDRRKRLDLATTLVGWEVRALPDGRLALRLDTRSTNDGSLRPATLLRAAAGVEPLRVCRVGLWHEEADGTLVSPL